MKFKNYFNLFLISLILVQYGCQEDVTKDYLSESPAQVVVECIFTPTTPWEVHINKTIKLNKEYQEITPEISYVQIIDDGNRIIDLNYDEKKKTYVSDEFPQVGHHYKLEVKIPDHPLITAEDEIPSKIEVYDLHVDYTKQSFVEEDTEPDKYYKVSFRIKKDQKTAPFFKTSYTTEDLVPEHIKFLPNTLEEMKKHHIHKEIISKISYLQDEHISDYDYFERTIDWRLVINETMSKEKINDLEDRYGTKVNTILYDMRDYLPIEYESERHFSYSTRSRDIIFSENKNIGNILMGNLQYYNNHLIKIYTSESYYTPIKDFEEAFKMKGNRITYHKLKFLALSKSLNRYMRDVEIQQNTENELFSPTIMINSNIKNGIGIFGGANKSSVILYYSKSGYSNYNINE